MTEYSFDPLTAESGYTGYGISSFFQFPAEMFSNLENFTFAVRFKLDRSVSYTERILYIGAETELYPHIFLDIAPNGLYTVSVYDGNETASVSFTAISEEWAHIAFTFTVGFFGNNTLAVYYNGMKMGQTFTNVDITEITGKFSYMTDFHIDDLYVSNKALSESEIELMQSVSLRDFLSSRGEQIEIPDNPFLPDDPKTDNPIEPDENQGWSFPEGLMATDYTWIAYTFDGSFNAAKDLNKQADAKINTMYSTLITVGDSKAGESGRALTRRASVYPSEYMSLDQGLLFDADEFTFAARVYRETEKSSESYKTSNMKLLDFSGKGSLVFAPFITDENGESESRFAVDTEKDYGTSLFGYDLTPEKRYDITKSSLSTVNGKWAHYALTYSSGGTVCIYVNGVLTNTFETGVALSDLDLTELSIMTGSSESDDSRYYIDDVYMAARVLDAADIRRIEHYGVSRFVSEVLADPNPDDKSDSNSENSVTEIDLRPDSTDELEDSVYETARINGFIGTTFDNMSLIGSDYNNSVPALVRNASLAQGYINYGLALDGMTSYIRYPLGILDNTDEFTLSIAYNWSGATTGSNHRLLDFSRKESSVSMPSAYMYIDMGSGSDGLKFVMSDGNSEVVLSSNCNTVNKWVRVSVTLKNGTVRLYIDGAEVDSKTTSITPASIKPNFNYIGKSGIKGGTLFKGYVDEIYISDSALSAVELQTIQTYGIDPDIPTISDDPSVDSESDIWDTIITGVVVAAGGMIAVLVIVMIVTIIKK